MSKIVILSPKKAKSYGKFTGNRTLTLSDTDYDGAHADTQNKWPLTLSDTGKDDPRFPQYWRPKFRYEAIWVTNGEQIKSSNRKINLNRIYNELWEKRPLTMSDTDFAHRYLNCLNSENLNCVKG